MSVLIIQADARRIPLADKSVHCVVTSPPYWGLRDYGTAKWVGGDSECDHLVDRFKYTVSDKQASNAGSGSKQAKSICDCGAVRVDSQIGLERTPEGYIAVMLEVFREVKRVLRDDGTLWLNMGDSYQGGDRGNYGKTRGGNGIQATNLGSDTISAPNRFPIPGLKPKDLCGIPWLLAFALRADGWYLRSDIIWSKPNPMPESVTDRPTKAHEYIFLLSKSERYYYDADAILEACSPGTHARLSQDIQNQIGSERANGGAKTNGNMKAVLPASYKGSLPGRRNGPGQDRRSSNDRRPKAWDQDMGSNRTLVAGHRRKMAEPGSGTKNNSDFNEAMAIMPMARNKRTVWTVNTQSFAEAHFATFPEELIKPCILAGCPVGGVVLDPFAGSGTTALVARNLQCSAVGLELNAAYIEIAKRRLSQEVLEFA